MVSLKCKEIFCLVYSALLFISGIILILITSYLCYKVFSHNKFVPSGTVGPFILLFLLGFVHLFVCWLGVKGPTREHDFHIILFMVLSLILLLGELSIGVWSMVLWGRAKDESTQLLTDFFNKMTQSNNIEGDWLSLQRSLHCCGLNNSKDYTYVDSCFYTQDDIKNSVVMEGCKIPFIKHIKRILVNGAILAFLCTILQAIGIFTYFIFLKSLREKRTERINRRLALQRELSGQAQPVPPENNPENSSAPPVAASVPTTKAQS